jgi:uncharacterized membrane protein YkvA (DUF1232 family)
MSWGVVWGIVAGLVAVWLLLLAILWVLRPRGVPLGQLVRVVPDVLRLVRQLLGDSSVPFGVRAALVGLLAWLINPIDLVPEFIPVLGPLDDVVVAVLVLRYVRRRLGDDELWRRWPGTSEGYSLLSKILRRASANCTPTTRPRIEPRPWSWAKNCTGACSSERPRGTVTITSG